MATIDKVTDPDQIAHCRDLPAKEMERVEAAVREEWEVESIAITHRIGRLEIGEVSVAIAVASPHREEAMEARHFATARLKQIVPAWKQEFWEGGEVWIENADGFTCPVGKRKTSPQTVRFQNSVFFTAKGVKKTNIKGSHRMPPLLSRKILLSSGWTPLRRPSVRLTFFPALCLGMALVLGGCSGQGGNSNEQGKNQRRAVTLNGTQEAKPAPSPKFKKLTIGQVGRSLRRITVRVSRYIQANLGDPTPFHTDAQINWAEKMIAERIPHLKPDQRLQLHYIDQFHKFLVEVEIWAEGNQLVYYFTKLAARDELPDRDIGIDRPLSWVTLVEQPGQSVSYDNRADILKDQLFGPGVVVVGTREEKQDAIQKALAGEIIDTKESRRLSRLVETAPHISLADFKTYLEKRETLKISFLQDIITRKEFETLRDRLKKSMTQ